MSDFTFDEPLARLAGALGRAKIPYMVIGGQAVIHHGEPRFTKDIDFTVGVPPSELSRVLSALLSLGLRPDVDDPQGFVDRTHVLPLLDAARRLRVDVSFTDSAYEAQAIARGVDVPVRGVPVRFASAEDLVIHKLIAGRPLDLVDVKSVLLKNPGLDLRDVRRWLTLFAEALEEPLLDRLDQVLRDARMR
jgi:hypothetical protein